MVLSAILTAGLFAAEDVPPVVAAPPQPSGMLIGSVFDIDSGFFTLRDIPTAFAGPRILTSIERSCSCLDVESDNLSPDVIVEPGGVISIFGSIRPNANPGEHQA